MSEPVSTTTATAAVAAASLLTLLPGVDPAVVIGAFTGAVLFIISDDSNSKLKRTALFIVSFFGGMLSAQWAASLLSSLLPQSLPVNAGMAAIIASACAVRLLQFVMQQSPANWLSLLNIRGKP